MSKPIRLELVGTVRPDRRSLGYAGAIYRVTMDDHQRDILVPVKSGYDLDYDRAAFLSGEPKGEWEGLRELQPFIITDPKDQVPSFLKQRLKDVGSAKTKGPQLAGAVKL